MKIEPLKYSQALHKSYFRQNVQRNVFEVFKTNFIKLFERINETESEEHNKNIIAQFLRDTYYFNNYEINTADRKDLVIHKSSTSQSPVAVIIEAKSPANKAEMPSIEKPNVKALHEVIHYYMHERLIKKNNEIKHVIITNIYSWFIFDASEFEKYFFQNSSFLTAYQQWTEKQLVGTTTDWFYNEIAKPFVENEIEEMECVCINLHDYFLQTTPQPVLIEEDKLINLFKIFSPEHLLKQVFINDYNTIDLDFYNELLYCLGLEEVKSGGIKIITRIKANNRKSGSLLENAISIIESRQRLKNIEYIDEFGENEAEQLFSVALELCITWLNRILFLKLLEGQLIKYHKNSQNYAFLNIKKIANFNELDELFFDVFAILPENRSEAVLEKFGNLPYLNSSLFERTDLESKTVQMSDLKDRLTLPIFSASVLKTRKGEKMSGQLNTLEYLFEFLNAYNFASETKTEIQDDNRTIINAPVLGLIFEKINGYKDGSFFTPGFITTYISHETLQKAIIQKFSEHFKIKISDFEHLKDVINFIDRDERKKANEIINSIKICDPAVGSGHFLVSALNEMIALKSELQVLEYTDGKRIKEYKITNENDELIITDRETEQVFSYILNEKNHPYDELQKLQESLFNEKRLLIEKCLFGVDINPKSVSICRLRLWIELLKNSYYTRSSNFEYLETLPNIDINIKVGNSLVSRYSLNGNNGSNGNSQKLKQTSTELKLQVELYKNMLDKKAKEKNVQAVKTLKSNFESLINPLDTDYKELKKKRGERVQTFIAYSKEEMIQWEKKMMRLDKEIAELDAKYNQKLRTIYSRSMEWRYEFPEVLDENGYFVGFDIVMGNPPYYLEDRIARKKFYANNYVSVKFKINLFTLFIERIFAITSKNGIASMIVPNLLFANDSQSKIREYILKKSSILKLVNIGDGVFTHVAMPTMVFSLTKNIMENNEIQIYPHVSKEMDLSNSFFVKQDSFLNNYNFVFETTSPLNSVLVNKIIDNSEFLENYVDINQGVITGNDSALISEKAFSKNSKPIVRGKDISKYSIINPQLFIEYDKKKLACARSEDIFTCGEKLLMRRTADAPVVCYDNQQFYNLHTLYSCRVKNKTLNIKYILALLNSKLIKFIYQQKLGTEINRTFAEIKILYIRKLPLKVIDSLKQEKTIKMVDKILQQKQENPNADTSKLEQQIDNEVYKLYNLNSEEINIIENDSTATI